MPGVIEKNVLRLKISVDNLKAVQTLESAQQLCGIETGSVDIKSLFPLQMVEQLSAVHKRQYEVQLLGRLEREFQRNNKRIVDLRKNRPLGKCVCDFRSRNNVSLANCLEGVDPTSILLPVIFRVLAVWRQNK